MTSLSRRRVLAAGVAGAAASLLPMVLARAQVSKRLALPIPPELRADSEGRIAITARSGMVRFGSRRPTPAFGYNGAFLGPAIRLRRGKGVNIDFSNHLSEPTTLHWHGLVIPGEVDGGPHRPVLPGAVWRPRLEVDQPAATLWFHPHFYPSTAGQVIKGLAGLLIVDDAETDQLALPSRWGIDDIPLIIQDRRFEANGAFFERMNMTAVTNGYVGDVALVNGVPYPQARTPRSWVRLRMLDGSNARSYRLKASDDRSLFVIASDGGLLEHPVELKEILIHAGERFEVMVDCRSGIPFDLVALPTGQPIMRLPPFDEPVPLVTILPDGAVGEGRLPESLVKLPPTPAALPAISQELVMNMFRDKEGMMALAKAGLGMSGTKMAMGNEHGEMTAVAKIDPAVIAQVTRLIEDQPPLPLAEQLSANGVNGKSFALHAAGFTARRGELLRWRISEGDDPMPHPVHIHGCQFRILSHNGNPPEAHRAGWKDIAPIAEGGANEILVRFPHGAGVNAPYMAHCHILEHEDSGMMAQFTVA